MKTVRIQSTHCLADLLILGAGPAGCAAAISALQSGMNVALLEAQGSPRLLPGETLHPGVEPIFKQLGIWDSLLEHRFHRHRGIWRESDTRNRIFEPYGSDDNGPWLGFQVDRLRLNELLRARVTRLGGKIVPITKLDDLLHEGSDVAGVCANDCCFEARFVLDATGRRCWLAKKLGLIAGRSEPKQRVRFGWTNETLPELAEQPLFRQRKDGWDWLAPLGDGRCAWAKLRLISEGDGVDFTWRVFRECAGRGYFLLGDAACLMDPSAASGVLRALMSGIYAVHLITAVRQGTLNAQNAALEYKWWAGDMFDRTITDFNYLRTNLAESEKGICS